MTEGLRVLDVLRVNGGHRVRDGDVAAIEEPMEVRIDGESFAVLMRTPGSDRELAAGFLLSEGVVRDPSELGTIEHCAVADDATRRNVVNVHLLYDGHRTRLDQRRRVMINSSCGLCGRVTLESLEAEAPCITAQWTLDPAVVHELPVRLRGRQTLFDRAGGSHAAGLFDPGGRLETLAEDVGRHNAVDKVIGRRLLREDLPLGETTLVVSGRASFEIVQKAFLAGIPVVCAVSAPTSLAAELAERAGITLLGFVRGDSFNVYSHPDRLG